MKRTGFQFTDRDAEILNYVYQLRVATLEHLSALLKPRPHKGLYVLGPTAVTALIESGYAWEELAGNRRREIEWKDLMIPHTLLIASIHTKLLLLSRDCTIQLDDWQHDHMRLWDSVETSVGKLPVRPDAYFVLRDVGRPPGNQRHHFFLEADVGTMSHTRLAQKIKAYAAYHQQQRHVTKFGIDYFQVAVITQTRTRAENLRAELYAPMSTAQRRAYHFVSVHELSAEVLLGAEDRAAG